MSTVTAPLHVMNNYARWPISLVKGKGNQVWDDQGKAYLDFTSGIAVTSLGHVPPKVTAKLHEQLDTLWHCSNLVHIPQQQILAEKLSRLSGLDQAFFCNSGAEANEGLIKLARRYAQKVKGEDRYEVITFAQSFHGRTLATLTATGQDKVKDGFLPLPAGFVTVPYNDLAAVQSAINDKTCAIMLELVQGEGGVHPAEEAWVKSLRDLCDEHGLLLLVDEIQTGIGRTGTWFAFQQYGVKPDAISLAKGLGSGFPIGAVVATKEVAEAFSPGTHGTTFGGNPLAATAGIATLATMEEEQILDQVAHIHQVLTQELEKLKAEHPDKIVTVRGKGLLLGVELTIPAGDIVTYAREKGVIFLTAGPQVLRLLPSFVTTDEEVKQAMAVFGEALEQA
ncbi:MULTISPECIES: aspartate aminotransferase family protein [Brevibacillus]|jgi:acetylornithine and succinylornithine aminotransferases|uniref:Acetylornithine aminotransferase n=1 Tax=Brevibacillus parabrevis TaxID=54914 RepID=A0A4Y3PP56_BREPA|nr:MULTISPECIES: aspartate aminotransferase family protein [Brevibacillus]MBU8713701.1 aspartate aminotransferase family protein [Brevibacillus parabrevis]MDR4997962.1 aspartate aminotransferase family protein [Brevibacillus parabrevis]RNB93171.1 aspartate aminotransferase family protein [Brevibacillus parabrevis]GEB35134.1 acetylornithine aminotransferase [Brevibacillus parabrevis]HBZ81720.1 aspartate aminotransferase family protein [Brevibacillus sp.]